MVLAWLGQNANFTQTFLGLSTEYRLIFVRASRRVRERILPNTINSTQFIVQPSIQPSTQASVHDSAQAFANATQGSQTSTEPPWIFLGIIPRISLRNFLWNFLWSLLWNLLLTFPPSTLRILLESFLGKILQTLIYPALTSFYYYYYYYFFFLSKYALSGFTILFNI